MPILIGLVVIFLLMFILGVSRQIIVFCALALMLIFSVFCVVFFIVSFINLLRSKSVGGRFVGFSYWDRESDSDDSNPEGNVVVKVTDTKEQNKVAFAAYKIHDDENKIVRNMFPTDEFMLKLYKPDEDIIIRVCNIGRKQYTFDKVTMIIIFIGLPVFSIITGILVPLIMQYMYIFNA